MDLQAYMAERGAWVDAELERLLPPAGEAPAALHGAMRHLVFPGGKRFRPLLVMAAAEAVGGRAEDALPMAAAVELVHTYSLVHDDLPCMDDDSERRGRPTVHVVYGEAVAVLAGDALQCLAFEALAGAAGRVSAERVALAVGDLALAVGSRQLVGGQVADLAFDPADTDLARIESVHARKTAALIAVSIAGGARLAGASAAQIAELDLFGQEVGIAFQIADDLLDADEEDLCSLANALGLDAARERAQRLLETAMKRIENLGERAEPLRDLARYAVQRKL
ncbi:MAG: polyprenyl synthetase family protein [Deltaproteobacteria bacterium]|nr:polyprenyl synthetase family protein [Deltaproteobacteria bacterium]MBW2418568.1 polyprenyl synthetase family protein [Deltaproteobacteria bacterium]